MTKRRHREQSNGQRSKKQCDGVVTLASAGSSPVDIDQSGASSSVAASAAIVVSDDGDASGPTDDAPTTVPEPGFPSGFHLMHDITASGVRKYYIPAYRFRQNITEEELARIPADYWEEKSQHLPECMCIACTTIWDKDYEPDWSLVPSQRPE